MNNFKRTLIVCWFGVFVTNLGLSQVAPILPLYMRELGYTNPADIAFYSGLAFGITPLLMAFFSPIWAIVGAKFGYKKMLIRASLGMAVSTLALSFVSSAEEIIIIRFITGVVSGFNSGAVVFIAIIAPKQSVAAALGTLSTASISGGLIGPLFGGILAEFFAIHTMFDVVSLCLFASFLTVLFFIKEDAPSKDVKKHAQSPKNSKSLIAVLFLSTFIIQSGTFGLAPMITLLVDEIYNGAYIAFFAGLVVASSGISNLFFATKISRIADKIGPSKVIFAALLFCGAMFYLQAKASNVYILILWRVLLGVGLGGLLPCVNALLKKAVSEKSLSLIFGFNQTAQFLGAFSGAFLGGLLSAKLSVSFAFSLVGLVFILNAFVFLFFERKHIFSKGDL